MGQEALLATLILGGMCGLMWFLARLAKKRMGIGAGTVAGDGLRVVGKRPLDQKNALYVLEIAGGRHILVGASADGGGISKVDDISAEEFAAMTQDEERPTRRLRVANTGSGAAPEGDEPADEQRFATVGESFSLLLSKARRRASGE